MADWTNTRLNLRYHWKTVLVWIVAIGVFVAVMVGGLSALRLNLHLDRVGLTHPAGQHTDAALGGIRARIIDEGRGVVHAEGRRPGAPVLACPGLMAARLTAPLHPKIVVSYRKNTQNWGGKRDGGVIRDRKRSSWRKSDVVSASPVLWARCRFVSGSCCPRLGVRRASPVSRWRRAPDRGPLLQKWSLYGVLPSAMASADPASGRAME